MKRERRLQACVLFVRIAFPRCAAQCAPRHNIAYISVPPRVRVVYVAAYGMRRVGVRGAGGEGGSCAVEMETEKLACEGESGDRSIIWL